MAILAIDTIRIEGMSANGPCPVITDRERPRFSFSVSSDRQNAFLQSALIRVNGWESEVSDQRCIEYAGRALESFSEYIVHLLVTDDIGDRTSGQAIFRTGRMDLPWQGKWISDGTYSFKSPESPVPMCFRRFFTAKLAVKKLRILATAMGIFDLYLDGRRVHEDYFNPGFTDYAAHLQYVVYDLDDLMAGQHEFSAVVAGGWAAGRTTYVANTTKSKSRLSADRQALLAELRIEYQDGQTEILGTDEHFEVTEDGPWRFADFYDGERYDANLEISKAVWRSSTIEKLKVWPEIRARYGCAVLANEVMKPVAWLLSPSGELICDFGQNIAGVVSFELTGYAGQVITFRHAEAMEQDELYTKNLRSARQTLTYICREGKQSFSPRFTYMGFRFVGIRGVTVGVRDVTVGIRDVTMEGLNLTAVAVYANLATTGSFRCSDRDLNQLQSNLVWSGKGNFVDIPTDCPQRDERQGWTGDIALFSSTACFNFDMSRFLEKWLLDMKSEQNIMGSIPFVIPSRKGITPVITTSCWGDSCILVPWELYLSEGDPHILAVMYPVMKKYMADVKRWAALSLPIYGSPHILKLPFQFGDWCAPYGGVPDWLAKGPCLGTAYYAHSCQLMAQIAAILGKDQDSRRFAKRQKKVRNAFIKVFTDGHGRMKDEFQSAYVLALCFGLVAEKDRHTMADCLWSLIRDNDCHLATGFTATPYLLFALADNGFEYEAYQLLLQDSDPSWLYAIRHGASTLWEQWGAVREDGSIKEASLNHYAYGAVGDFFYRRICGLEALEPGYRHFQVKPVLGGGLQFAECEHRCPYGTIRVRWDRTETTCKLQVCVPVGSTCDVIMPDGEKITVGSGKHES